jgi:hypothetical protein
MNELFEIADSKSPRLRWIDKHGIWTKRYNSPSIHADFAWIAMAPGLSAIGATEDQAIVNLAIQMGIPLWNEE